MTRQEQYADFIDMQCKLYAYAKAQGIPIRQGEAQRPQWVAAEYAKEGTGTLDSKHIYSLAIDLWIINGKQIIWVDKRYALLGTFWKSLGGIWGGDFKKRSDPYHFEYAQAPANI
jgi:hypothetical protein